MAYKMLVDIDRCIGCWTCAMGCKVGNHLADDEYRVEVKTHGSGIGIDRPAGVYPDLHMWWQPIYLPSCTFCAPRVAAGELPFCVMDCPTQALALGDDADAESAYAQAKARVEGRGAKVWALDDAGEATRAAVEYATAR
ncbi:MULTISPECIES: 4Fe-4S dicluster domain-containing protein [unclassified Adlercreutzia]|uniref:4Fe-4S dicluster domain-containing protein n=1 Tax=unclassified Adlercreutzia TaxID=2636013 RepID=UPI0013EBCE55|nr:MULTISPECIES: 4Fe-4S dicluster domain-containing protein [unclassified Adlercreutzia]